MTDWLMVIITTVYVIATIVICVFNGKSASASKEQVATAKQQIDEMMRQYNESNRPVVMIRFDIIRSGLLCFVIENIGSLAATDLNVQINNDFLENLQKVNKQTRLRQISDSSIFLASHQKIYVYLGGQSQFAEIAEVVAKFDITYNDKYAEHTEIDLWQYQFMLLYNSELEDISQHLKKIENEDKSYHQKLLKAISKDRPVSVQIHTCNESEKAEAYETVIVDPKDTSERIADTVDIPNDKAHDILENSGCVDEIDEADLQENTMNRHGIVANEEVNQ